MPDLPPDWAMPQQEILHHSACEIQTALYLCTRTHRQNPFSLRLIGLLELV